MKKKACKQGSAARAFTILILLILLVSPVFPADLSLDQIIQKLQSNRSKIVDMYSEMKTTMAGQGKMSAMNSVQKSRMWEKGDDKSKIEIFEPIKQTTIRNGDNLVILDLNTGHKIAKDLAKDKFAATSSSQGKMDFNKMKEIFDLSVRSNADTYIIACTPKKSGFFGKTEIYIDNEKFIPLKILTYDRNNKIMNRIDVGYAEISGIFVPVKNHSSINSPLGKMSIDVEYTNIKVNEGIKDSEFGIL